MLTISAAHVAQEGGIRIYTYVMGQDALSEPLALEEAARISGGKYIPTPHPAEILTLLEQVKFVDLRSLEINNATMNQLASEILLNPEGYFIAIVPITKGMNEIVVTATADDDTQAWSSLYLSCFGKAEGETLAFDLAKENLSDLKLALEKKRKKLLNLTPLQSEREPTVKPTPMLDKEGLELEPR